MRDSTVFHLRKIQPLERSGALIMFIVFGSYYANIDRSCSHCPVKFLETPFYCLLNCELGLINDHFKVILLSALMAARPPNRKRTYSTISRIARKLLAMVHGGSGTSSVRRMVGVQHRPGYQNCSEGRCWLHLFETMIF